MKKIVSLALAACLLFSLFLSVASAVSYPTTGITRESVKMRQDTNTKSKVLENLKKGKDLIVEGEEEVDGVLWYKVTTPKKGKVGYVQGIYLSVQDNDLIEAIDQSSKAKTMTVTIEGRCDDYKNLGKSYSAVCEINGIRLPGTSLPIKKKATAKLAPDEEFAFLTYLKSKNADGTERSTYTPTEAELESGFSVSQTVTCISFKTQKEIVWVVTYTFMPEGAKAAKDTKTTTDTKDTKTTTTSSDPEINYDLSASSEKPTGAVKREIDHYEEREVEVTERVVSGYKTYIAYEVDENGKPKAVEKQKPVYTLQKVKKVVKVPVYKDEMPEGSTTTTDSTGTAGSADDEEPEEPEEVDEEVEEEG